MKVVINKCFGGFSLSRAAVKRMAELQRRPCYFFTTDPANIDKYIPYREREGRDLFWSAFDIPNPNEVLRENTRWHELSETEKTASNALYDKHSLTNREVERTDPLVIRVVEELGKEANGACAELKIVEIPDGVEFVIDEYDGLESIHEVHRSWG